MYIVLLGKCRFTFGYDERETDERAEFSYILNCKENLAMKFLDIATIC